MDTLSSRGCSHSNWITAEKAVFLYISPLLSLTSTSAAVLPTTPMWHSNPTEYQVYNFGLFLIDKIMHAAGKSLKDLWDMPYFTGDWEEIIGNCLVAEQLDYDEITELERASSFNISKLVPKTSQ